MVLLLVATFVTTLLHRGKWVPDKVRVEEKSKNLQVGNESKKSLKIYKSETK